MQQSFLTSNEKCFKSFSGLYVCIKLYYWRSSSRSIRVFKRYCMIIAEDKTETLCFGDEGAPYQAKKLPGKERSKVPIPGLLAWDKCPEMKHIFTDRKIHIPLWLEPKCSRVQCARDCRTQSRHGYCYKNTGNCLFFEARAFYSFNQRIMPSRSEDIFFSVFLSVIFYFYFLSVKTISRNM